MYKVSTSHARHVLSLFRAAGLDVQLLCEQCGIDQGLLTQPDAYVPRDSVYRLVELGVRYSRDSHIGLKAYNYFLPGSFHLVGYTMMSSFNLKEALERLVRFSPLLGAGFTLSLVEENGCCRLIGCEFEQEGSVRPRQYVDLAFASLLGFCRWLTGGNLPSPLGIDFSYPRPDDISEHQRVFGCPLRFGAAYDSVLFDGRAVLQPLSTANDALALLHEGYAESRMDLLAADSMLVKVRSVLTQRMGAGQGGYDMASVAAALCISTRTLQRGLARDGIQFTELLSDIRRRLADFYLRHSHYNMKHIANFLGFHDQSSFHKACLRWFGMSPGQYRKSDWSLACDDEDKLHRTSPSGAGE